MDHGSELVVWILWMSVGLYGHNRELLFVHDGPFDTSEMCVAYGERWYKKARQKFRHVSYHCASAPPAWGVPVEEFMSRQAAFINGAQSLDGDGINPYQRRDYRQAWHEGRAQALMDRHDNETNASARAQLMRRHRIELRKAEAEK